MSACGATFSAARLDSTFSAAGNRRGPTDRAALQSKYVSHLLQDGHSPWPYAGLAIDHVCLRTGQGDWLSRLSSFGQSWSTVITLPHRYVGVGWLEVCGNRWRLRSGGIDGGILDPAWQRNCEYIFGLMCSSILWN